MERTCIALVGGRGAGKSKISRKFGKLTGRVVFSTDTLVSYEGAGVTIERLVATYGWQNFRDREFDVLQKLKSMKNVVIDCGGGILVEAPGAQTKQETFSERKAALLKSFCKIVYIKRDMDWLHSKSGKDSGRPDLIGEYEDILNRRLPWYEKIADMTVDMTGLEADGVAKILAESYP